MTEPGELIALAKVVQEKVDEVCPDVEPMKMRAVMLLVGEAYLQAAATDKVMNDFYRRPPSK